MTIAIHGAGVSDGIAIGRVHLVERSQFEIPEYDIPAASIDTEIQRFQDAVALARLQLRAVRDHIPRAATPGIAAFIDTHLLMLEDVTLTTEPSRIIRERLCNAEWALKLQRDALVAVFEEMDDAYLRTRKDDVEHVVNRLQRILLNHGPMRHEQPDSRLRGYILLADDLSPADTVLMQHHGIAAFAIQYGGPTSHTAILARSLGIPGIVGLHGGRQLIREDELIIVDGSVGVVIVDPDERVLAHYRQRQDERGAYLRRLDALRAQPARTIDRQDVTLRANVELPIDFVLARDIGAEGIGLYRTEYLFLNRADRPGEDELFTIYRDLVEDMQGMPVTFRTLDVGGEKALPGQTQQGEANPALGLRAVRLCLRELGLFVPQLRAIIRASAFGNTRLMIPMLSNLDEIWQVLSMIDDIRAQFRRQGIAFDATMPIGGMVEVPAAALCADAFAEPLDFLSLGTNDLIQYTLAIDRVNEAVSYLYDPLHPAVLRLIAMTLAAGRRAGKPVAMCGEMAGDARYTRLLLALGLREFSVHPRNLLAIKHIINTTDLQAIEPLAESFLAASGQTDHRNLLQEINAGLAIAAE